MKKIFETERLLLRELEGYDREAMFELNRDPEVVRYVGVDAMVDIAEAGHYVKVGRQRYAEDGCGRWAVVLKATNEMIGWSGLRPVEDFGGCIDLGYRYMKKHWGKGYASEAAAACLDYGFKELNMGRIDAHCMVENKASERVMQKIGMTFEGEYELGTKKVVRYFKNKP